MDFSKLLSQIDSVTTKKSYDDEDQSQYFRLTVDKAGNASAVIRFLPDADIDEVPFVRMFKHSFKNPDTNRWYIENSLSTLGQQDYISEVNRELWNSGIESNKEICRRQKRKLGFISNIYVIKDSGNPENNGKVLKYRYGKKIFDMICALAKPDEDLGQAPVNAFDPNAGANFILKQKEVSGWPNFDESKFGPAGPLFGGDADKISEVLGKCYSLQEEVAPSKFKSPEELEKKYKWVMGLDAKTAPKKSEYDKELDELEASAKSEKTTPKAESKPKPKAPPVATPAADDDDDAFFKSLIED